MCKNPEECLSSLPMPDCKKVYFMTLPSLKATEAPRREGEKCPVLGIFVFFKTYGPIHKPV